MSVKVGDKLTISGIYRNKLNPKWRWWTFWRDKWIVEAGILQQFTVVA